MSLKDVYSRFLTNPKSVPLATDASLVYITTTTKVDGDAAIVSHFSKQQRIVKTKSETILDAFESTNSLCLDIETTLEFVSGGGAYLPQLDDNFLADHVATFPTVHIVRFNAQQQIQNVRIYWDQASLLKQVEVIGSRARGWPIRDAKDQFRLLKSAISSSPSDHGPGSASAPAPPASTEEKARVPERQIASPGKKYIKDPHAADSLFELLSPGKDSKDRGEPVRAPRAPASAQPPARDYGELFLSTEGDFDNDTPDASPSRKRIPPKAGTKNLQPSRIFDHDEAATKEGLQQIAYKAHPKRYDHFELGGDNSTREVHEKPGRPVSRQAPHWDFEDFVTPEKPKRQLRGEEIRHFGWGDDEQEPTSVPVRSRAQHPRPDAETHFSVTETPEERPGGRIISSFQNKGLGLYKNHLFDNKEDDEFSQNANAPLSRVNNNGANRKKELETHWDMADESPRDSKRNAENRKPIPGDRQKAVKALEPSWDTYDQSPEPTKMAPPQRQSVRNHNQRSWNFGAEN
ncbi:uncharacterized protein BO66DRAFT_186661 [Aspergillus aculeatinus CBS 121060]|uniref:Uncharacterized protein n=2 Tax=Aspergillus TaxID=5052 RepID=A0A8G1VYK9_9EURO|nr:hypothetical protein BO66DRAFT_186661 [Aspergillus aculeatinus CBS 121060]XP_040800421.1 uncharacterized protein BO72DRAFT_448920 [Aspergillus fijiensis CBS 313.89]RAH66247.1 hypothetical protein BO66DRAFT_186661 [Aspergillus aculeatinus CBS 121060]RAK76411.1 hypothetical protein BO72DRAFT_448920 [Aspergillus fijiensis CBS 313.89]